MLTMADLFQNFAFLQGTPAVLLIAGTAALILFLRDWRWSLAALVVQYLAAGLLFAGLLEPQMAGVKVVVGLFTCLILYLTGRQVEWHYPFIDISSSSKRPERTVSIGPLAVPAGMLLRSALALVVGAVTLLLLPRSEQNPLPGLVALAAYLLIVMGLVTLGVHLQPYKAGMGLLSFLTGFDLLYSALAFSSTMLIFFTAAHLLVALVISYMTQRHYLSLPHQV
jgi:hypothetical protein